MVHDFSLIVAQPVKKFPSFMKPKDFNHVHKRLPLLQCLEPVECSTHRGEEYRITNLFVLPREMYGMNAISVTLLNIMVI
jgi:hypothetical protein